MTHQPRKRFGQNFLQNSAIIHQIITSLQLKPEDKVIEIGPGMGALTTPLLQQLSALTAIEIDRDLQAYLKTHLPHADKLQLVNQDALTCDFSQWGNHLRLVGNLPYNISTPLILHLLSFKDNIEDMHFMLQKEVVDRLAGQPGSKAYGRLSVMVQYHCEVQSLFEVPPEAFFPQPKVQSAIVRLRPYVNSPYPEVDMVKFQHIVAKAFAMRRKTLANNLKPAISAQTLASLGIDPSLRPEQIDIMDFVKLSRL